MRTKLTFIVILSTIGAVSGSSPAQPRQWADDFWAAATYDSASLLAPCYGGPKTKYTVFQNPSGDIFNEQAVSSGGKFVVTNRTFGSFPFPDGRSEMCVIGWLSLPVGCPGEPPVFTSTEPFTSPKVCIYGGFEFSPWQLQTGPRFGGDGQPGVAGVDDDGDGTTDGTIGDVGIDDDGDGTTDELNEVPDEDESPVLWPSAVNNGYGDFDGTGFHAGVDQAPGVAGFDDDSNGIIDDIGETGWPGTDDGDDQQDRLAWDVFIRLDLSVSSGFWLHIDPGSTRPLDPDTDAPFQKFSFWKMVFLAYPDCTGLTPSSCIPEPSDEFFFLGMYDPYTHYNYRFCTTGTCFGAQLWAKGQMNNPIETLGPYTSTEFTSANPEANLVALQNGPVSARPDWQVDLTDSPKVLTRRAVWRGNTNFSHTFWVVSGDQSSFDFGTGYFGYPSPSSDLNNDRDVDANDFLTFSNCFNGSLNPPHSPPNCSVQEGIAADFDEDGDVDASDFLTFSNCFNGSLMRPRPLCFPQNALCGLGGTGASMSGGGSLLAQSAIAFDPFLFDGMTPVEEFWYFYTPTCTGDADLALCDGTGQGRSVDGIHFAFFDGTSEEATVVPATACGQSARETVPVVSGQTVYLLVYRDAGAESLDGFTLSVTCGP